MAKFQPVVLDGRTLEGGGQLLRNALCLAALTKRSLVVDNIRGSRSGGGGLKAQHLACVEWLAFASEATVTGGKLGSTELEFEPTLHPQKPPRAFTKTKLPSGEEVYKASCDIGTAGSTTLALQAILPFILFADQPERLPVHLTLNGGTNVSSSPSYEYLAQVLLPTLVQIGLPEITASLPRRGMNRIGRMELIIPPITTWPLPAINFGSVSMSETGGRLERDVKPPLRIHATFIGSEELHESIRLTVTKLIQQYFPSIQCTSGASTSTPSPPLDVSSSGLTFDFESVTKGFYILITATSSPQPPTNQTYILARDLLTSPRLFIDKVTSSGKSKLSPKRESPGLQTLSRALNTVIKNLAKDWASGAWVDEHLRDQLVIYRALASGTSEVSVGVDEEGTAREASLHAQTAEWVAKKVLHAQFEENGKCLGVGHVPGLGYLQPRFI